MRDDSSFDYEAFAKAKLTTGTAEKRALMKAFTALLSNEDVIERIGRCPMTVIGIATLLSRQTRDAAFLAEAYAVGQSQTAGFLPAEPEIRIETLQITCVDEPDPTLVARLGGEAFSRISEADARPMIFMGVGSLAAWKGVQGPGVRITRSDLAASMIRGTTMPPGCDGTLRGPIAHATSGEQDADIAPMDRPSTFSAIDPAPAAPSTDIAAPTHPYARATIAAPPDVRLHLASDAQYEVLIGDVIRQQGPVDIETAIESIRLGLDLGAIRTNTRRKLRDAVARLGDAVVVTRGGFYHAAGATVVPRDRSGCEPALRRVAMLPPVEIEAAVMAVLSDATPMKEDALVVASAGRLGYLLTSPASNAVLSTRIRTAMEATLDRGEIVRIDGRIHRSAHAPQGGTANPDGTTVLSDASVDVGSVAAGIDTGCAAEGGAVAVAAEDRLLDDGEPDEPLGQAA